MEFKKIDKYSGSFNTAHSGYLGYLRLYYRSGSWSGRWFNADQDTTVFGGVTGMDDVELEDLNNLRDLIARVWPRGCDWYMEHSLKEYDAQISAEENHFLLEATGRRVLFLIFFNTTFGNGDYPVRIHCYRLEPGEIHCV